MEKLIKLEMIIQGISVAKISFKASVRGNGKVHKYWVSQSQESDSISLL